MNVYTFLPVVSFAALALATATRAASVNLSEVLYDAAGADDGGVFVELYGPAGLALDDFRLEGVNGSNGGVGPVLVLAGSVGADGLFVVADAFADGTTGVSGADQLLEFDLQNGPDSLQLVAPDGTLVDALGYGEFGAGEVFAGEGSPAPDGAAGQSLARRFADVDTNDNLSDFVLLDAPTPGMAVVSAPETPPTLLVLAALATLALRRPSAR